MSSPEIYPPPDFISPPERVVSLVPSLTESMFDLGFGKALVGITDYCVHPAEKLVNLPRLGGPKNPDVSAILALKPDLILANQEENTPAVIESLESAGIVVWLSFPKTVAEAMTVLWNLAGIFKDPVALARLKTLEMSVSWLESTVEETPGLRYFCPIWQGESGAGQRWWMSFNRHTYAHDVLRLAGGANVFADRERRYPLEADLGLAEPRAAGERDTRYPRVTREEIVSAEPEVILLPSEPFAFTQADLEEIQWVFPDTPAVRRGGVHLVDGSLLTWHGTRLGLALQELPGYFS